MLRRAFTLLELILVVAILATLAGAATSLVGGVQEQANADIARREMYALREAILRFHADTGWLPGEGPFDLEIYEGRVTVERVKLEMPEAQWPRLEQWFYSASNIWQLVDNPLVTVLPGPPPTVTLNHPLGRWDPDRRRGWNGPYLSMNGEGQVRVSFLDGRSGWDGDFEVLPAGSLSNPGALWFAPAVADPFLRPNVADAPTEPPFQWISDLEPGVVPRLQGRPYVVLLPRESGRIQRHAARIVCLGADGELNSDDDIVVHLFR